MLKQLSNIGLEVSCNGNGQAVYYLGPGRTSGPFVLERGLNIGKGVKKNGLPKVRGESRLWAALT
jgi:hypothetical protein